MSDESKPTGPAGDWCPVCGMAWQVRGCTRERCAFTPTPASPCPGCSHIDGRHEQGCRVMLSQLNQAAAPAREDSIPFLPSRPDIGAPAPVDREKIRRVLAAEIGPELAERALGGAKREPATPTAELPVINSRPEFGGNLPTIDDPAAERVAATQGVAFRTSTPTRLPLPPPMCLHDGCDKLAGRDARGYVYRYCERHQAEVSPPHPAPWRWEGPAGNRVLVDADGVLLIQLYRGELRVASPAVGETVRAAPEMEALLRTMVERSKGYTFMPNIVHEAAALLDAIDRASKAGG